MLFQSRHVVLVEVLIIKKAACTTWKEFSFTQRGMSYKQWSFLYYTVFGDILRFDYLHPKWKYFPAFTTAGLSLREWLPASISLQKDLCSFPQHLLHRKGTTQGALTKKSCKAQRSECLCDWCIFNNCTKRATQFFIKSVYSPTEFNRKRRGAHSLLTVVIVVLNRTYVSAYNNVACELWEFF